MPTEHKHNLVRKAYHKLILPSGEEVSMVVCTFDSAGHFLSWEHFTQELPYVNWCGGVYDLRKS